MTNTGRQILIQLAPFLIIIVLAVLLSPLIDRLFKRDKSLKDLLIEKRKRFKEEAKQKKAEFKQNIKETGGCPSKEQFNQFHDGMKALGKDYMETTWDITKERMSVRAEELGLNKRIENSKVFYIASMLATPIPAPIVLGISSYFIPETSGGNLRLLLLPLSMAGAWLGYKGYMSLQNKKALALCLSMNALYGAFLLLGAILLS